MAFRPDLVDVWIFRVASGAPEVLLMRRSAGRVLAGLWQGVSGRLEDGERVVEGALRELREETGFERPVVEAFFDLDFVNQFHYAPLDAVLTAAVFAARVTADAEPVLSHEHDSARWVGLEAAHAEVVWPGYRDALRRIGENLLDPERARWFELGSDGLDMTG
ncbi:MAG TPA: NUDIX domain-containing protein [Candidatus Acidoferrum sp.]|nr:NUDIX domain-containing protein [Candidatus Acidoferrum sp.]